MDSIARLNQVKKGSTLMISFKGVEHQVMVQGVSRCQIDVSGMQFVNDEFQTFVRHFTTKGKIKYLKNEDSRVIKVLTL